MGRPVVVKTKRKCNFCKIKENDKIKYGPLYKMNQIVAHYYCVLCSTRMKQNGKDNEGIMGFLTQDINLELRRTKKISCAYCREKNATVECANATCKKVFHFPCGLQNGALSRFRNDFVTFCSKHRPQQKIPKKVFDQAIASDLICAICYDAVDPRNKKDNLWAPCCVRSWYHRECVQTLAHSSGYFFRCATCNDAEKFKAHMEDNGIFVPQQDASWELVPNAYEELLVRHNRCDAEECKCPDGREENVEETRWEIVLCRFCGSQGIHVGCGNLRLTEPQWECSTCQGIMQTDSKSNKVEEDYKSEVPVPKPSPKSITEEPEPVPRKRKLSVQRKTKRRKKDKDNDDSKKGKPAPKDDSDDDDENKSEDEFYIKIPEFLYKGRKSGQSHTATGPDGEEEQNEEQESEEESDEDVDVISVDTAWLMVEEVLSRVKPRPLSYKLKFLRKKRFAYHFDPFDVREEKVETIDLTSDSEDDNTSVLEVDKKTDGDSDIEIIGEVKVGSDKKMPEQELENMEPYMTDDQSENMFENDIIPEEAVAPEPPVLLDNEMFISELFEGDVASEGSVGAQEPIVSDMSQGSEGNEILENASNESRPVTPMEARLYSLSSDSCFQGAMSASYGQRNSDEEIVLTDPESDFEYFYDEGAYDFIAPGQKLDITSLRRRGRKHSASALQHDSKVKRVRASETTSDNSAVDVNSQSQVDAKMVEQAGSPNSMMLSTSLSSYSTEQILESNQGSVDVLNPTSLNIMEQPKLPKTLVPDSSMFPTQSEDSQAQPYINASVSRTIVTSFGNDPSTFQMELTMPSTSGMAISTPSIAEIVSSTPSIAEIVSSTSTTRLFMASTPERASIPSSGVRLESGISTPLPSFQFLTSLQANISPLNSSSNSSYSFPQNASHRVVQSRDNSSSGCSDMHIAEDNDPLESAP